VAATLIEIDVPAGEGAPATPSVAILPPGATRGVVVIHEIFGRQPEIDRAVERFAAKGYAAVAPDLFRRGKIACLVDTFKLMKTGDGVGARQGRNARAWLCGQTGIPAAQVGLIGFCFGGGFALAAGAGWGAVSANYAHLPDRRTMEGLGPTIACYGKRDRTLARAPAALRARFEASGRTDCEVLEFDAGHSFLTDGKAHFIQRIGPMGFGDRPVEREEAWSRIFAFFDRHLGGAEAWS
jgi:carboxymethylenebutenolidase